MFSRLLSMGARLFISLYCFSHNSKHIAHNLEFLNSEKNLHISLQKKTEWLRCKLRIQRKRVKTVRYKEKKSEFWVYITQFAQEKKCQDCEIISYLKLIVPYIIGPILFSKIYKIKNFYDWMNSRHIFSLRKKK